MNVNIIQEHTKLSLLMLSHCCVSVTLLELLMIYTLAAPLVSHVNDNYFSLYTFSVIHRHRAVLDHSSLIAQRPACKLLVHSCEVTPWNLNFIHYQRKTLMRLCSELTRCSCQIVQWISKGSQPQHHIQHYFFYLLSWPVSAMKWRKKMFPKFSTLVP